jgi:phage tail-like protein
VRPEGPTFWRLDGLTGWRTADAGARQVAVAATGMRLAADPAGPLGLASADGSLGGLRLPRGIAVDPDGTVWLLVPEAWAVRRFDPEAGRFVDVKTIGGRGWMARQVRRPCALAVAGRNLYLADRGNRRVQVFGIDGLDLRHLFAAGDPVGRWDPVDVTSGPGGAYVLDRRGGRLWRHRPGRDRLDLLLERSRAGSWSRVLVDDQERLYLLDEALGRLEVFDPRGRPLGWVADPGEIRDRFPPPAVRASSGGRFALPASLRRRCDRRPPPPPAGPGVPLPWSDPTAPVFDRTGKPSAFTAEERPGPARYAREGSWTSTALDSQIYRCEWHRVQVELDALPDGAKVEVLTYTDATQRSDREIADLPPDRWVQAATAAGREGPPDAPAARPDPIDALVRNPEARYLWVRLRLRGDGSTSPMARTIRVHYPRVSYLDFLPAVFAADDESRSFLARFLAVFQTEWDELERTIRDVARYFDPAAAPDKAALAYLAGWLGLRLEQAWDERQQRQFLSAAPGLRPRRGTPDGVRGHLSAYLENIIGRPVGGPDAYPRVVEGFRRRDHMVLAPTDRARLGSDAPLWSPSVAGRIQLGAFATEGEVRLVSTGQPDQDLFARYAHRFSVFIPSAWIATAEDERMVRRALDEAKPAHTAYDLCLVEPGVRVGLQSTVGLDTIVGSPRHTRLACPDDPDRPKSRPPAPRLGYDTVLAEPARPGAARGDPPARVGMDPLLA